MALQIRRGTEAERTSGSFIPLLGEPIFTTDEKKLYIGDGSTVGGVSVGTGQDLGALSDVELESDVVRVITSVAASGNEVTFTTVEPHGFSTGDSLTINVTGKTELNGNIVISAISATTFTFPFQIADFVEETEAGSARYRAPDESILGYNQATGKWTEHEYVYNLDGLGDVDITNPQDEDIVQYELTPVGDITEVNDEGETVIVSSAVEDPGESIPEGQTWTQTGIVSHFVNKPFRISFNNLDDVFVNPSTLADQQILTYDSTLQFWVNSDYVDSLEDLNDVVTNLPETYLTETSLTVDGYFGQDDIAVLTLNDVIFEVEITQAVLIEAQDRYFQDQVNLTFDGELRKYIAELFEGLINADTNLTVIPTRTDNKIVFTDNTYDTIRIQANVQEPVTDNLDPLLTVERPTPPQVLMHDGTNWVNGGISFNNFNLNRLYDVSIQSPTDGQIIQYNEQTGFWSNANNLISLTQFSDVYIGTPQTNDQPQGGEGLIYDDTQNQFITRKFSLTDMDDVTTDMGFGFIPGVIPDGSVLAYDSGENKWQPKQFSTIASRNEVIFYAGPTEAMGIAECDFEAFTGYGILKIRTEPRATVTFYTDAFSRQEDLDRAFDTYTPPNAGIFAELTTPDTSYHRVAPIVYGFNDDLPVSRKAYAKVRNRSGYYSSQIKITLTLLQIEEDPSLT